MNKEKFTLLHITIFFTIATTLSAAFRHGLIGWYNNLSLPFGLTIVAKALLEGIGPITGALVVLLTTKKTSLISLWGTQSRKSALMLLIPILLFTFFGANNTENINKHLFGFITSLSLVLYGIFEEYGWRGYLHNELSGLKPLYRSLMIGGLWYVWHLSFLSSDTTIANELKFLGLLVFASWGIGAIADKTKSVIACACFHIAGNILITSPFISASVNSQTRFILFAACLAVWIYVVNIWDKNAQVVSQV